MHTTQDFEHVLDCENVVGVEYVSGSQSAPDGAASDGVAGDDEDGDVVHVFVTEKIPEAELDEADVVANAIPDRQTKVEGVGEVSVQPAEDVAPASDDRQQQHRPIPAGVSECNYNGTAATGGTFPARIDDLDAAEWAADAEEGETVRLSNNHVYARSNKASFGEPIVQPSRMDGGTPTSQVGGMHGYVPIEEGVTVDVAARTMHEEDTDAVHNYDGESGSVLRDYSGLKGRTLVKSGRTTGVTRGEVKATSASIRVGYGGDVGVTTVRDQIITTDMSDGGDSGSPVFDERGNHVGLVFAGSDKVSVICKAANVEDELGVTLMPERDKGGSGGDEAQYVKSLDTSVSVPMEDRDLDLLDLSGDKPHGGETVTLTAVVGGNYSGRAYLDVQGERYTATLTEGDYEDMDYGAEMEVEVTAPTDAEESFDVNIEGGYIIDS